MDTLNKLAEAAASASANSRQTAEDAIRQTVKRLRHEADHLEALADHASTLEPGSKSEEALWMLAVGRRYHT